MNINIPNIFTKVVTAALLGSAAICAASFFSTALSSVRALNGYHTTFSVSVLPNQALGDLKE